MGERWPGGLPPSGPESFRREPVRLKVVVREGFFFLILLPPPPAPPPPAPQHAPAPLRVQVAIFMSCTAVKSHPDFWWKNSAKRQGWRAFDRSPKTTALVSLQLSAHRFHLCLFCCDHYVSIILSQPSHPHTHTHPRCSQHW